MIKDPRNESAYSEVFDMPALRDIAEMAKKYVESDGHAFHSIPDGTYSDFACNVWVLMCELVRYQPKN